MHLYPDLQDLARLHPDDGDDVQGRPPYQITPEDIDLYHKSPGPGDEVPAINVGGRTQTSFKIIELYRQLVHHDKKDNLSEVTDGNIGESRWHKRVVIPKYAKGHHYWGKRWTPMRRLTSFLSNYKEMFNELTGKMDQAFPRAKSYIMGKVSSKNDFDDTNLEISDLSEEESGFIKTLADDVKKGGFERYASLLEMGEKYAKTLKIHVVPGRVRHARMESKAFGYTHLFIMDDSPVLLIKYPDFGQANFFDHRGCIFLKDEEGRPVRNKRGRKVELCMQLDGINKRGTVLENYLKPYSTEYDFTQGMPEKLHYKWGRIAYYLRKARVYNLHRYNMQELKDPATRESIFYKGIVLHEFLHYRNSTIPAASEVLSSGMNDASQIYDRLLDELLEPAEITENLMGGWLLHSGRALIGMGEVVEKTARHFIENLSDPYDRNHVAGTYLVYLQAVALEGEMVAEEKLRERRRVLRMNGGDENTDPQCRDLERSLHFVRQLAILAVDAEERLIEDEVYSVLFDKEDLKEFEWATEEDLILNRNEIGQNGLLRREERQFVREKEEQD